MCFFFTKPYDFVAQQGLVQSAGQAGAFAAQQGIVQSAGHATFASQHGFAQSAAQAFTASPAADTVLPSTGSFSAQPTRKIADRAKTNTNIVIFFNISNLHFLNSKFL